MSIEVRVAKDGTEALSLAQHKLHMMYWQPSLKSNRQDVLGPSVWSTKDDMPEQADLCFVRGRAAVFLVSMGLQSGNSRDVLEAVAKAVEFRAIRIPEIGLAGVSAGDKQRLEDEFISLKDLAAKGATTKSYVQGDSKFADVTINGRTYTFEQLSWYVQTPDGKVELHSPAIPYDCDLYVPSAFVKPLL